LSAASRPSHISQFLKVLSKTIISDRIFRSGGSYEAINKHTETACNNEGGNTKMNATAIDNQIKLSDENLAEFSKATKIAYYKLFRKNGLITDRQFEILMKMQSAK
jgi:hypothetical protein